MNAVGTLKTLFHLSLSPIRGETHEERLESFYRRQAVDYDSFRKRLLHGRGEMLHSLPVVPDSVWCDIGAGTGESAQMLHHRLADFAQVHLVDLCPSLLRVARQRIAENGWRNVNVMQADAETLSMSPESVDLVTFSYALTMIPNWFSALERAWNILRPGGHIGVADFYVARKHSANGMASHSWFTRTFWPAWFGSDNVFPSHDHLPYLKRRFAEVRARECRGKLPFLPGVRVPYYIFIGCKR